MKWKPPVVKEKKKPNSGGFVVTEKKKREKCYANSSSCFGINWKFATPADVQGINVRKVGSRTPLHLHKAAQFSENPDIIDALIQAGAYINAKTYSGQTPLHWAAEHNKNPNLIYPLIQAGAEINAKDNDGNTPLHLAAKNNNNPEVIALLIALGANPQATNNNGKTPEMLANYDSIYYLKNIKAYQEGVKRALKIAAIIEKREKREQEELKNLGGVNWPTADVADVAEALPREASPAVAAATPRKSRKRKFRGRPSQNVLNLGMQVVSTGPGQEGTVMLIGTDLSQRHRRTGKTVLHSAARYSTPEVVAALITSGSMRVDGRDKDGATALHAAIEIGNVGALAVLIEKININTQDKDGNTPLHYAVIANQQRAVLWLLENGADTTISNAYGKTPLTLAYGNIAFISSEAYWALNDAKLNNASDAPTETN